LVHCVGLWLHPLMLLNQNSIVYITSTHCGSHLLDSHGTEMLVILAN